jgi:RecA-family ATPase
LIVAQQPAGTCSKADISDDANVEIEPREWLVPDRIPMEEPTLFTGDGAAGKTTIGSQLCAAVVWAGDWFGKMVEKPGNVLFISAEEDDREIKRKFEAVAVSRDRSRHELRGVKFISFANEPNCTLAIASPRTEQVTPTPLYHQIVKAAVEHDCRLVYLEAVGDFFVGNHMSTPQVRAFIALMRVMAKTAHAAVVLVQHPSQSGMKEGTGTFGSVMWRNTCRAQMYLYGIKGEHDEPDVDRRVLEWKKNNYAPGGERVIVRWDRGVFVPEGSAPPLAKMAEDARIDDLFLKLLDIKTSQGILVGPNEKAAARYAPRIFERMSEAGGIKVKAFALSMERLLSANRIRIVDSPGSPSKRFPVIVRKETVSGGLAC